MPFTRLRTKRVLVPVLLFLILIALWGLAWRAVQDLLREQGIQRLDWHGLSLSRAGLELDDLELQRLTGDGGQWRVHGEGLRVGWPRRAEGGWTPREVEVRQLSLSGQPGQAPAPAAAPFDPAALESVLARLPPALRIAAFTLDLPCAAGRCVQRGAAELSHPAGAEEALALRLVLYRGTQTLELLGQGRKRPTGWTADVQAHLDGQALLSGDSDFESGAAGLVWRGRLNLPGTSTAGLAAWLADWMPPAQRLPDGPAELHLDARWQLRLGEAKNTLDPARILEGSGQVQLDLDLPQAWPVPGLGALRGKLSADALGEDGRWWPRRLESDLHLDALQGDWLLALPVEFRPRSLGLRIQPLAVSDAADSGARGVQVALSGEGAGRLELQSWVQIPADAYWPIELEETRLRLADASVQRDGLSARGLNLDLRARGQIQPDGLRLELLPASTLRAARLDLPGEVRMRDLRGKPAGLAVQVDYPGDRPLAFGVRGPVEVEAAEVAQPHLLPQGWRFRGRLDAEGRRQALKGALTNDSGLALALSGGREDTGALRLKLGLAELFFRAGNPLAKTFGDWPTTLEFASGRLQGQANLSLNAGPAPVEMGMDLSFRGLEGLYDRSELRGLQGRLALRLNGETLELDAPELRLEQANPGFPLGPLQARGRYRAGLGAPLAGRLDWQQAESGLFGGRAWLEPGTASLGESSQRLALHLDGVQLKEILRVYPAEGLAGAGTLDGEVPILLEKGVPRVEKGRLSARAPGYLQFRSEKIRALGRSNPGMQLVADALDDFHYDRLSSALSYDERGKLLLGLTLQGRNPDVEKGRPINLNVNLEEDLPALLTSLQLTDRVSETIRQRVQERLRQRNAPSP
ncbi:YdbH domain-containing protein [Pseudomonas sp. RIT-PI-AD]|uniref:YdbH domain-containing protein n=1 Tax=Pseudomonas sp. RIT-PI-AD TaxID=3035294 RepID=UPI0021D97BEB|nr:YdbH domain-containing protein [Pseudomonas sp. RIT-PI-AD]